MDGRAELLASFSDCWAEQESHRFRDRYSKRHLLVILDIFSASLLHPCMGNITDQWRLEEKEVRASVLASHL